MKEIIHKDPLLQKGRRVAQVTGWPLLGNSVAAAKNPLKFLLKVRSQYEDIAAIVLAGRKYIVLQSPAACRHVLQENAKNYYKPGLAKLMKKFMGDGLATSNGAWWLQQRRLLQPAFHRTKIEGLIATAKEESALLVRAWHHKNKQQQPTDITAAMLELTLGNIAKAMFGKDIKKEVPEIYSIINEMLSAAASAVSSWVQLPLFLPTPGNKRLLKAARQFNAIIDEMVEQRLNEQDTTADLFDLLLQAYQKGAEKGMSRQRLKEEIFTIFITGHETTAQTLSWVLYHLALYPSVYARMREEMAGVQEGQITMDTLQRLRYTKAVIEETMRLYPPVWLIARKSTADDSIAGYDVPAGATVLINIYGMNHHQPYWPLPGNFYPERFITDGSPQRDPFLYLPFGGGQRLCIGHSFAMMVMQLVLFSLVKEFRFSLPAAAKPVPLPGITLRAKGGIQLMVKPFH